MQPALKRLTVTSFALSLLALSGCGVSRDDYYGQHEELAAKSCASLESMLHKSQSKREVKLIRYIQAEKNCEVRPQYVSLERMETGERMPSWRKKKEKDDRVFQDIETHEPD